MYGHVRQNVTINMSRGTAVTNYRNKPKASDKNYRHMPLQIDIQKAVSITPHYLSILFHIKDV